MRTLLVRFILILIPVVAGLAACAPAGKGGGSDARVHKNPGDDPDTIYKPVPLLWEGHQNDGVLWSAFTYQIIGSSVANILLPGSGDVIDFCPNYEGMSDPQKVNFWAFLISAIAKYESGFNPVSRAKHEGKKDDVTKESKYSEGLLQLSYQDILTYSFCEFDWVADAIRVPGDPKRTILDPFKNLECGIKILATQVKFTGKIVDEVAGYWDALKGTGNSGHAKQIQALTKGLPFCKAK